MGERDIYIDAGVNFLKSGAKPDRRIGTVTGSRLELKPYDPQVVREIADEKVIAGSRGFPLRLKRAS